MLLHHSASDTLRLFLHCVSFFLESCWSGHELNRVVLKISQRCQQQGALPTSDVQCPSPKPFQCTKWQQQPSLCCCICLSSAWEGAGSFGWAGAARRGWILGSPAVNRFCCTDPCRSAPLQGCAFLELLKEADKPEWLLASYPKFFWLEWAHEWYGQK